MSLALQLLAAHLVGDFILQTGWMARGKTDSAGVRAVHVAFYLVPFVPVGLYHGWPLAHALGLLAVLHYVTDKRRWVEPKDGFESYPIVVDQTLHIVQLAIVATLFGA